MKKYFTAVGVLFLLLMLAGCSTEPATSEPTPDPTTLTVYTYDSLSADYGLLPQIVDQFEQAEGVTLEIMSFPDTGVMLNQLIAERDEPKADVVLGLDNITFEEARVQDVLQVYQPKRAEKIPKRLRFDDNNTMTPFDYGYVGFVYDSEAIQFPEPVSLMQLATDPAYKDKIIIEQPGLSSPGTQLLFWTHTALDEPGAEAFWQAMAEQVLTVAPDWNTAYYSMFLNGEAPIVLSYLTSPAYHIDQEGTERYKAIPIKEGYLEQVEGVAVVNGTDAGDAAGAFIDYLLTDEVQNKIPTTQWMFPVLGDPTKWPEAYGKIIMPSHDEVLTIKPNTVTDSYDQWLSQWNTQFGF